MLLRVTQPSCPSQWITLASALQAMRLVHRRKHRFVCKRHAHERQRAQVVDCRELASNEVRTDSDVARDTSAVWGIVLQASVLLKIGGTSVP